MNEQRNITILAFYVGASQHSITHQKHISCSRRPRFRGKGAIGGGVGAYTYDWVGEQWLATWLAEERVVEAILGESCQDADGAGATAAAKKGEGSQGGREKLDHQVIYVIPSGCLSSGVARWYIPGDE